MDSALRSFAEGFKDLDKEVTEEDKVRALQKEFGVELLPSASSRPAERPAQAGDETIGPTGNRRLTRAGRSPAIPSSDAMGSAQAGDASGAAGTPIKKKQTVREKIWQVFAEPTSSRLALIVATFVVAMITLSVTAFIVQTLPEYVFSSDPVWSWIEVACVGVFTLEFLLRICTCPSVGDFLKSPLNLIDLLAILPFYIELITVGWQGNSSSAGIIRVLRLVRIFRIFKVARYLPWVRVFTAALALSVQPLLMLVFVIVIGMVVFASGMYYAERGEWDPQTGLWMRTDAFGNVAPSPFQSIPAAMWWAIITMTTVGYGDAFPVGPVGKVIASVAALSGIIVVAIPITVISTNFNSQLSNMEREKAKVKARMSMLAHHFAARKAGLAAVLDEVGDMVKRNTQEFESEVASLFEATRAELTEEISEIIKMAYERRRQLHLQALSAGRVTGSVVAAAAKPAVEAAESQTQSE